MFDPSRFTRGARRAAARTIQVSMFEIDVDDARPERVLLRDSQGAHSFVTEDGGRSWNRGDAHQRSSTLPPNP